VDFYLKSFANFLITDLSGGVTRMQGMVDPGEEITVTLKREFAEEAFNSHEMSADEKRKCQEQIDAFFLPNLGHVIYRVGPLLLGILFIYLCSGLCGRPAKH